MKEGEDMALYVLERVHNIISFFIPKREEGKINKEHI